MNLTAIILAGGKSTRMGTDKAILKMNGKTLLETVIGICQPVCSSIIISSNNPAHGVYGYPVIADEQKDCGPMSGIYSCLKKSENDWNFVLSVDTPYAELEFVNFLCSKTEKPDAVIPVHQTGFEPLIALYNRKLLPDFKNQLESGNYKMRFFLKNINVCFADSNDWIIKYPKLFHNINRREDLQK